MEELNYKNEIRDTRRGSLGSSDGALIAQVAQLSQVPKSAYKRLAVLKGFVEQEDIPQTAAVRAGDELEIMLFRHLSANDERYVSNPLWVSDKYSRKNVRLISHPEIVLLDEKNKVLNVYEVKCSKFSFQQTRSKYMPQLVIHFLLAKEIAHKFGNYKVRLSLAHYSTEGMNLEEGFEFDPSRLTVKYLRNIERISKTYEIEKGMDIINDFLETFAFYTEDESVPYEYLPENVQKEFDGITTLLTEIKQREATVEAFKAKLYEFLQSTNIQRIKNDSWSITRVDPTTSVQFDSKRYLDDYAHDHPKLYKKMREKYEKKVNKNGFVSIKIKDNNK